MRQLFYIMERQDFGSKPWHCDKSVSRIMWLAHDLGLIYRPSVSQVEWTTKGLDMIRKYAPDLCS